MVTEDCRELIRLLRNAALVLVGLVILLAVAGAAYQFIATEDAARLYKAAVSMARSEGASHESTWQQACRLMKILNPSAEERALIRAAFAQLPDCA
jgi:hypothetical protein